MHFLKELKNNNFSVNSVQPKVRCRVFEDNSGAKEMATNQKIRPRINNLNIKLHHFMNDVTRMK